MGKPCGENFGLRLLISASGEGVAAATGSATSSMTAGTLDKVIEFKLCTNSAGQELVRASAGLRLVGPPAGVLIGVAGLSEAAESGEVDGIGTSICLMNEPESTAAANCENWE